MTPIRCGWSSRRSPGDDPAPQAVACHGLLARCGDQPAARREELWLRFIDGRPISAVTIAFVAWCAARAQERGKRAVLVIGDNASWHDSQIVRTWLRQHNRQVKRAGQGVRLISALLPSKSPWRNPIEPKWLHGKRKVMAPDRLLASAELAERVCAVYGCPHEAHLVTPPPATKRAA